MLETLAIIEERYKTLLNLPHVESVDDMRDSCKCFLVHLKGKYCFKSDPGCGTRAFDTLQQALEETSADNVYIDTTILNTKVMETAHDDKA